MDTDFDTAPADQLAAGAVVFGLVNLVACTLPDYLACPLATFF